MTTISPKKAGYLYQTMTVKFAKIYLTVFLGGLGVFAHAFGNDSILNVQKSKVERIDSFITALHAKGRFNGTVLVARNGKILYEKSIGLANFKSKDSIKSDYTYEMASVSKPITAAAIMLLFQRCRLDLEESLSKYLPELDYYKRVTINDLLHHTSGLPEYIYRFASIWDKDKYMTNDDLVDLMSKRRYRLAFTPGSRFHYCNTNYALLAKIVERISGEDFDEFVDENIFQPLGMCNTIVFNPQKDTLSCRKISGYFWNGNRYLEVNSDYRNGVVGDKGVFSTAYDMMRFEQILYSNIIFCDETIEKITAKNILTGGTECEYACGWRIREIEEKPVILHYGFWNSFRTGVLSFPQSRTTFVILNNTTGYKGHPMNNREDIIAELMKVMLPKIPQEPIMAQEPECIDEIFEESSEEGIEGEGEE